MKLGKILTIILTASIVIFISLYSHFSIVNNLNNKMDSIRKDINKNSLNINKVKKKLDSLHIYKNITATMYHPTKSQCWGDPTILADGTKINPYSASEYNYIAVSRDLLKKNGGRLEIDDYVYISVNNGGSLYKVKEKIKYDIEEKDNFASSKSGIYKVKDKMAWRLDNGTPIRNKIDFLESIGTKEYKINSVAIVKLGKRNCERFIDRSSELIKRRYNE